MNESNSYLELPSKKIFQEILKDKSQDTPRCPFCNDENIGLHDVDPKEKVE